MNPDLYKFICWLNGEVPKARVLRDLFRAKPKGGDDNGKEGNQLYEGKGKGLYQSMEIQG